MLVAVENYSNGKVSSPFKIRCDRSRMDWLGWVVEKKGKYGSYYGIGLIEFIQWGPNKGPDTKIAMRWVYKNGKDAPEVDDFRRVSQNLLDWLKLQGFENAGAQPGATVTAESVAAEATQPTEDEADELLPGRSMSYRIAFEHVERILYDSLEFAIRNGVCRLNKDPNTPPSVAIYTLTTNASFWREKDFVLGRVEIKSEMRGMTSVWLRPAQRDLARERFNELMKDFREKLKAQAAGAPETPPLQSQSAGNDPTASDQPGVTVIQINQMNMISGRDNTVKGDITYGDKVSSGTDQVL